MKCSWKLNSVPILNGELKVAMVGDSITLKKEGKEIIFSVKSNETEIASLVVDSVSFKDLHKGDSLTVYGGFKILVDANWII